MKELLRTQGAALQLRGAAVALVLGLSFSTGCQSNGPARIGPDRFDYNEAIASSAHEQMLLNLVRLRYSETPSFLTVTSVLTQYVWSGNVGVVGSGGESVGEPAWSVGGSAGARYIERPTISYAPLRGEEFASQMLQPIAPSRLLSLVNSGWPPEQLLVMSLSRVNDRVNARFDRDARGIDTLESFRDLMGLVVDLAKRGAIEAVERDGADWLILDDRGDAETARRIDEFRVAAGLDRERNEFRIVDRITGRKPDEITIRGRSLLQMMGFLSRGVALADGDDEAFGETEDPSLRPGSELVPFHVRSEDERPDDAFVTVRYRDRWFSIPLGDRRSKQAFGILTYIFQLQAPGASSAGPVLTVPAG